MTKHRTLCAVLLTMAAEIVEGACARHEAAVSAAGPEPSVAVVKIA